ncbi:MAG: hypothetical protein KAV87_13030 [Desulfobacteraceae bacterium]|nr:hypothetical protein [Desulfobacteraceae bacterium]
MAFESTTENFGIGDDLKLDSGQFFETGSDALGSAEDGSFTASQGLAALGAGASIFGSVQKFESNKKKIEQAIKQLEEAIRSERLGQAKTIVTTNRISTRTMDKLNEAQGANLAKQGASGLRASGSFTSVQTDVGRQARVANFFTFSEGEIAIRESKRRARLNREAIEELERQKDKLGLSLAVDIIGDIAGAAASFATAGA